MCKLFILDWNARNHTTVCKLFISDRNTWYHISWEQYWTSPGGNTPQDASCTATCLPSRKLYKLDEPDTQDTAGEARTNSAVMYSNGPPHMAKQKQDDQLEHTYSSYVRIRDVALKTCQMRWIIGRSGERGSGISVLVARHDDDDDITVCKLFAFDSTSHYNTTVRELLVRDWNTWYHKTVRKLFA